MDIVPPATGAPEVTLARNQPEYCPLIVAVYKGEQGGRIMVSRWQPTDEERLAIAEGQDIFVAQWIGQGLFRPILVTAGPEHWQVTRDPIGG